MQKASVGARIGAYLLDSLFLGIIGGVLFILTGSYELYTLAFLITMFLYFGICEGSAMSASLGKKICGLVVVDEAGQKLTMGQGFLRAVCRLVSNLTLGIGYLIGLFDPEGKALHDKLAKTFVISADSLSQAAYTPPAPTPQPVQRSSSMNNPHIVGMTGQFAGKMFPIPPQGALFGRDAASCDFAFPESAQGISRNHCKVSFNPQTQLFVLYDLGSSYGTFLGNGTKVTQGLPTALRPGDEFYLASHNNTFRVNF
jgi:uncharacterized RDD family membrane protein YckC